MSDAADLMKLSTEQLQMEKSQVLTHPNSPMPCEDHGVGTTVHSSKCNIIHFSPLKSYAYTTIF